MRLTKLTPLTRQLTHLALSLSLTLSPLSQAQDLTLPSTITEQTFCHQVIHSPEFNNDERRPSDGIKRTCQYMNRFYTWFLSLKPEHRETLLGLTEASTDVTPEDQTRFTRYQATVADSLYGLNVYDFNIVMASVANYDYAVHPELQPVLEALFEQVQAIHISQDPNKVLEIEESLFITFGAVAIGYLAGAKGYKVKRAFRRLNRRLHRRDEPKLLEDLRGDPIYLQSKAAPGQKPPQPRPTIDDEMTPIPRHRSLVLVENKTALQKIMFQTKKVLSGKFAKMGLVATTPLYFYDLFSDHKHSLRFAPSDLMHISQATMTCSLSQRLAQGRTSALPQQELESISAQVKALLRSASSPFLTVNSSFLVKESDGHQSERISKMSQQASGSQSQKYTLKPYLDPETRQAKFNRDALSEIISAMEPQCEAISLCSMVDDLERQAPQYLSEDDLSNLSQRCSVSLNKEPESNPVRVSEETPTDTFIEVIPQTVEPSQFTPEVVSWIDNMAALIQASGEPLASIIDGKLIHSRAWDAGAFKTLKERLGHVYEAYNSGDEEELAMAQEELLQSQKILAQLNVLVKISSELQIEEDWNSLKQVLQTITSQETIEDETMGQLLVEMEAVFTDAMSELSYKGVTAEDFLTPSAAPAAE